MYIFQTFYAIPSSRYSRRSNDRGGTGRGLAVTSLRNALHACRKSCGFLQSSCAVDTIQSDTSVQFSDDHSVDEREISTIDVAQSNTVYRTHTTVYLLWWSRPAMDHNHHHHHYPPHHHNSTMHHYHAPPYTKDYFLYEYSSGSESEGTSSLNSDCDSGNCGKISDFICLAIRMLFLSEP